MIQKKPVKERIIKIRFCPKCNGRNIIMLAGGSVGILQCVDCGFTSPIFPEKEFKLKPKIKK